MSDLNSSGGDVPVSGDRHQAALRALDLDAGDAFEWPPAPQPAAGADAADRVSDAHETDKPRQEATKAAAPVKPPAAIVAVPSPSMRGAIVRAPHTRDPHVRRKRATSVALGIVLAIAILEALYIAGALRLQTGPAPEPPRAEIAPAAPTPLPVPLAAASDAAAATGSTGRLIVRSEPSGAQVEIDGRAAGATPLTIEALAPGDHRVLLKRGTTEIRQTVHVEAGATVSIVAPLQPALGASGWLAIDVPAELDVIEKGTLLGTSRSRQILMQAGPHTIDLVNTEIGYSQTQSVQIEPGRVSRLAVTLPRSRVNINAIPWADVSIDGQRVGETPIGNLPVAIGVHTIVLRHPTLGEKVLSVTVKAGTVARVSADLRPAR